AAQNRRQASRNGGDADNRQFVNRKRADYAIGRHGRTAVAGQPPAILGSDERARQGGAQSIAGFFCSDNDNRTRLRGGLRFRRHIGSHFRNHAAVPSRTPTTKIFSLSAAAIVCSGSATIVLPAATARLASPALATSSIVRGPIDGRSK